MSDTDRRMTSDPLQEELREQYRESARERLREVGALLDVARTFSPGGAAENSQGQTESLRHALAELARHFHGFAGMGATYGFPRVSEIGDELEASIGPLIRGGLHPDAATVARWRELTGEIARELC